MKEKGKETKQEGWVLVVNKKKQREVNRKGCKWRKKKEDYARKKKRT